MRKLRLREIKDLPLATPLSAAARRPRPGLADPPGLAFSAAVLEAFSASWRLWCQEEAGRGLCVASV